MPAVYFQGLWTASVVDLQPIVTTSACAIVGADPCVRPALAEVCPAPQIHRRSGRFGHIADGSSSSLQYFKQPCIIDGMNKASATRIFECLSSGVRLDVYRLLVQKGPEGMVAGEIAAALELPATNMSFHLKALTHAHMLGVTQEGRFQRYRANIPLMLDLIAYLTEECCGGHPEQCADVLASVWGDRSKRPQSPSSGRRAGEQS